MSLGASTGTTLASFVLTANEAATPGNALYLVDLVATDPAGNATGFYYYDSSDGQEHLNPLDPAPRNGPGPETLS